MIQERPVCFDCREPVDTGSLVFEAPCGDLECASAAWHGLCLMKFREKRESGDRFEVIGILVKKAWSEEHTENEERP